jgi:hypothetical protein
MNLLVAVHYFAMSICDNPTIVEGHAPVHDITEEDVEEVRRWVVKYKDRLLGVWNQEMDLWRDLLHVLRTERGLPLKVQV